MRNTKRNTGVASSNADIIFFFLIQLHETVIKTKKQLYDIFTCCMTHP